MPSMTTRSKNADAHPGDPDKKHPRRSAEAMKALRQEKEDMQRAASEQTLRNIRTIAELEDQMVIDDRAFDTTSSIPARRPLRREGAQNPLKNITKIDDGSEEGDDEDEDEGEGERNSEGEGDGNSDNDGEEEEADDKDYIDPNGETDPDAVHTDVDEPPKKKAKKAAKVPTRSAINSVRSEPSSASVVQSRSSVSEKSKGSTASSKSAAPPAKAPEKTKGTGKGKRKAKGKDKVSASSEKADSHAPAITYVSS